MSDCEILKFFPEPIFKYKVDKFEQLNEELIKYIYELQNKDKEGIKRSNQGGWHSENFRLADENSIQKKFAIALQKYILNTFQNMGWKIKDKNIRIKEMWAIINKRDNFNISHIHPNCFLSAAYYVKAPDNCGRFIIENPNMAKKYAHPEIENKNELNIEITGLDIEEGDLIIFPSYLPHKVGKNQSGEERVVISFNVDIN